MNTIEDTLSTLPASAQFLAHFVMDNSRYAFQKTGEVPPGMFYVPESDKSIEVIDILDMTIESKPKVWAELRNLRSRYRIVGVVAEAWMAKCKPIKDRDIVRKLTTGETRVSELPQVYKIEVVMFQLWVGQRNIFFQAPIKRDPDALEEWTVFNDTLFPRDGMEKLDGAMAEGDGYQGDNN